MIFTLNIFIGFFEIDKPNVWKTVQIAVTKFYVESLMGYYGH